MPKSLKKHLIISYSSLVVFPLILVSIFFILLCTHVIKNEALRHEQVVAQRISSEVKLFFEGITKELNVAPKVLNLMEKTLDQQQDIIGALMSHNNLFQELILLDANGNEIVKTSLVDIIHKEDLKNRRLEDEFLIPKNTKEIYYSPVWFDELTGAPMLYTAVPVINIRTNNLVGVIVAKVLFKQVWEFLTKLPLEKGGNIYIVDDQERLVAHRNPSLVLKETKFHLPDHDGFQTGLSGSDVVMAIDKLKFGQQTFYIVAEKDKSEALKLAIRTTWTVIIFISAVLIASILLAFFMARRISAPINTLAKISLNIRDGELTAKAPPSDFAELSELSNAYNSMTNQLQQSLQSLHDEIIERKKAEKDLRFTKFTVDHSADPIFWIGSDSAFIYVNDAASRRLGYSVEELLRMSVHDIDPHFPHEAWETHWETLKKQGSIIFETEHRKKSGELIPVEVTANFMLFEDKEYNCAFVRDISERKQAEEERVKIEVQLQQAQKMEAIGTLAGGIAHDFNNILSAIMGYTELVRLQLKDDEQATGMLGEVLTASNRARALVKQILTFSRQAGGEKNLLQMHLVVKEAVKLLRASIPSTIEFQENIEKSDYQVIADPTQIHQIVMNLGTNAYHAMRDTGGVLAVKLTTVKVTKEDHKARQLQLRPGYFIKLTVSDTGHGMDRQIIERIFEPYFTTKQLGEGTGMGLATVHGIVKNHMGHITVHSEPGRGTTFHVYLPVANSASTVQSTDGIDDDIPTGKERILLVDDEKTILNMNKSMLEGLGYTIIGEPDPEKALERFIKNPKLFDLIITDMTMPKMTGARLAQEILAQKPGMPIILCTGFSEAIDKQKAAEIGIRAYVSKPIERTYLAKIIRKVLEEETAEREIST